MAAFMDPVPWQCENCGHLNGYGNYTTVPCYHNTTGYGWVPIVYTSSVSSSLSESIDELAKALRKISRPWKRDAKPDVPRKLGFRRYDFVPPGARVRLNSVQFAIV